jgi:hypothetical protein
VTTRRHARRAAIQCRSSRERCHRPCSQSQLACDYFREGAQRQAQQAVCRCDTGIDSRASCGAGNTVRRGCPRCRIRLRLRDRDRRERPPVIGTVGSRCVGRFTDCGAVVHARGLAPRTRTPLGPRSSPDHILGWRIVEQRPDETVCQLRAWFLNAYNTFLCVDGRLVWSTFVRYERSVARVVWPPVSLLHRPLVRIALRRAATHA